MHQIRISESAGDGGGHRKSTVPWIVEIHVRKTTTNEFERMLYEWQLDKHSCGTPKSISSHQIYSYKEISQNQYASHIKYRITLRL